MKIRFSKTLAAILAATTVTAISGISALAATSVVTNTTYDWNNSADADATVTVTSTVTDTDKKGAQVTYLVATSNPSDTGAIKYIDQAALDLTTGIAEFKFTAKQSVIYDAGITAKFGSDDTTVAGAMKSFAFVEGVDHFENGDADTEFEVTNATGSNAWYGTVSGNVSEYGIKVSKGEEEYTFPAKGSLNGTFYVEIVGADLTGWTVTGYSVAAE